MIRRIVPYLSPVWKVVVMKHSISILATQKTNVNRHIFAFMTGICGVEWDCASFSVLQYVTNVNWNIGRKVDKVDYTTLIPSVKDCGVFFETDFEILHLGILATKHIHTNTKNWCGWAYICIHESMFHQVLTGAWTRVNLHVCVYDMGAFPRACVRACVPTCMREENACVRACMRVRVLLELTCKQERDCRSLNGGIYGGL